MARAMVEKVDKWDRNGVGATVRSALIIECMALLELLFRDLAFEIRSHIESIDGAEAQLAGRLKILTTDWGRARTDDRQGLLARWALLESKEVAPLSGWPESFSFADGRTINDETFEIVWAVLGLSGDPLPHPSTKKLLKDLAARRNRIAHGEVALIAEGRTLTFGNVDDKLEVVRSCVEGLDIALDAWCKKKGWKRTGKLK